MLMFLPQILCSQLIFSRNIHEEIRVALARGILIQMNLFDFFFKFIRFKPYSIILNPTQVFLFLYRLKLQKIISIANYLEIRIYLQ